MIATPPEVKQFNKDLGKELKRVWKERKLTLDQVADYLNTWKSKVSYIEKGLRNLSVYDLDKLADTYGVTPNDLINASKTTHIIQEKSK